MDCFGIRDIFGDNCFRSLCCLLLFMDVCFCQSFKCLFTILTQEAWVEVVEETLQAVEGDNRVPLAFVAMYFCMVHMFMQLVSNHSSMFSVRAY